MRTDDDRPSNGGDATRSVGDTADAGAIPEPEPRTSDTPLSPPPEVPSRHMDDHDHDVTGELELPEDSDDLEPHPAKSDPGFDGWLDGEEGETTTGDPYTSLSTPDEDDDAAEIAEWMAFTNAASSSGADEHEPDVVVDVTDGGSDVDDGPSEGDGIDTPIIEPVDDAGDEPRDDTNEFFLDEAVEEQPDGDEKEIAVEDRAAIAPVVEEPEAPEPEDEPEPDVPTETAAADELQAVPVIPIVAPIVDETADGGDGTDIGIDDTGEIPIVAATGGEAAPGTGSPVFDYQDDDELTSEHYLHAATREHHELAAAVTAARGTETEQVAVSAAIPGLESGVVGFDDVVAAAGDDAGAPATPPRTPSDLLVRVGTAVALIVAFAASLLWRPAIIVLALAVFVIAAGEFYSVLIHRRYKPVSIFGFLGIVGAGLGTVVWGVIAIPITFALMITVLLLFDAVSQRRRGAVTGFTLTILVAFWTGGLGAFAFPIIASDDYQALVLTVIAMVALVDIAAYGVGRAIGRRPFAPIISPKKTIEGFVGGTLMAFLAGSVASFFVSSIDLPAGLLLGAVVAVFAPLGDLAVSVVKRSLDIKDMGSILPGHGGLLDRVDAIIAVLPAAWAALLWLGLL